MVYCTSTNYFSYYGFLLCNSSKILWYRHLTQIINCTLTAWKYLTIVSRTRFNVFCLFTSKDYLSFLFFNLKLFCLTNIDKAWRTYSDFWGNNSALFEHNIVNMIEICWMIYLCSTFLYQEIAIYIVIR